MRRSLRGRLSTRHHLLPLGALLVLVLLAGCSAPGSLSMDPVTDGEIAERASRSLERSGPGPDAGDDPEVRMLRDALENGSGTMEASSPPVREGLPFAYDGAYYDLTWEVVDRRTATSVSIEIDYNATDPEGERIAYEDLPAPDRRAMDALLPPKYDRGTEGYDFGAATTYDDAEVAESVLVPEQRYDVVVFEGEAYPVRVDGTREITINTYRYTASEIASSQDEYVRDLKDEYLFTLSGLSEAEQSVVESAIDDSYYPEDEEDEAFGSVVERFRRHEPVEGEERRGEWLVRYEGEVYWANLDYEAFVDE